MARSIRAFQAYGRVETAVGHVPMERRSRVRFPLKLPVNFQTLSRRSPSGGAGWVVNMSSAGVLTQRANMKHMIAARSGISQAFGRRLRNARRNCSSASLAPCAGSAFSRAGRCGWRMDNIFC